MVLFLWNFLQLAAALADLIEPENHTENYARECALPEYLRGIGWTKVEDLLLQDLRIGNAIVPTHYAVDLDVDVRGYNGAEESGFAGTVFIDLNIVEPVRGIELHAVGLDIRKASITLLESDILLRTTSCIINSLRETVTLFENEEFKPQHARLAIAFIGTSYRNGYGLFETWSRMDGESPRIALTTFTSPTGARYWFPSFDEPDKKATFQLTVNHANTLNPYSNTRVDSSMAMNPNRTRTVFAKTSLLPTYMLAMTLNDLPFESITYMNHTVRAFGPGSDIAVIQARNALDKLWTDWRFKELPFITEKTDIFIFEDIDMALEYPGMMVLPVGAVEQGEYIMEHEFVHMYFGNLVTPSTFDNSWIIEGFATLIPGLEKNNLVRPSAPGFSSLHESAVFENRRFVNTISSTIHYTDSYITYVKSAQIFDYISRVNSLFWNNTKNLLVNNEYGNVNGGSVIDEISKRKPDAIKHLLADLITQPGKGLLVVNQDNCTVNFNVMRYHSSYFDENLRDFYGTPIVLPIKFSINGIKYELVLREDSTFFIPNNCHNSLIIHNDHWALMEIVYETPAPTVDVAIRSILASAEIGYFTFDQLIDNIRSNLHLFDLNSFRNLFTELRYIIFPDAFWTSVTTHACPERNMSRLLQDYENSTLADTRRYFSADILTKNLLCGFSNASDYERFLHRTFLENDPIVRPRDLISLLMSAERKQFPGVFADFFFFFYVKNPNHFLRHELLLIFEAMFGSMPMSELRVEQLRAFVRTNTEFAASLNEKVAVALEKHYVEKRRTEFYNVTTAQFDSAIVKLRFDMYLRGPRERQMLRDRILNLNSEGKCLINC